MKKSNPPPPTGRTKKEREAWIVNKAKELQAELDENKPPTPTPAQKRREAKIEKESKLIELNRRSQSVLSTILQAHDELRRLNRMIVNLVSKVFETDVLEINMSESKFRAAPAHERLTIGNWDGHWVVTGLILVPGNKVRVVVKRYKTSNGTTGKSEYFMEPQTFEALVKYRAITCTQANGTKKVIK